ncbi:MAG: UDP-glucose:undecaprenyl-phosphate glucose-1-phosphate transferase [candidate division BRC1 bacterium ADurb.BinA364]|nr:MAG: UDP-glucose:undecaprenyl-phosphate glucose-1-phosphate transferase [candidate division BRC1 bacterium ADurb.BinA364]
MGRILQFSLALLLLLLAFPLLALLFVIVLWDSGAPFLYRGRRAGLHGKSFWMYKIRTLPRNAEHRIGARIVDYDNEPITWIGKFLRETKLDELPQLINVLKGDMNFVGPRPVRPVVYDRCIKTIPQYSRRFEVKPGITGLAQIRGKYDSAPQEKLKYELEFIRQDSPGYRARIVLETVGLLLLNALSKRFSFWSSSDRSLAALKSSSRFLFDRTDAADALAARKSA